MRKKLLTLVLALTFATSITACGIGKNSDNKQARQDSLASEKLVRKTDYGEVKGIMDEDCAIWYGVPYGKAPVGDLRWKAPEDPDSWTDTKDCSKAADVAIQAATDNETGETIAKGSEDCLNLDIYAKEDAKDLPVLVYIHGGNNQTGTSTEIVGNQIVKRDDCVYVSLNYRLGALGFNCLPALQTEDNSTGNYALLDIAKGLDWVKENIEEFGGNPDNITVSGFSAGGRDVMAMLISPIFKGKFNKAVVYSGGMTVADEDLSAKQIAKAIAPLAIEDGKASSIEEATNWLLQTGDDVKEYLYGIDAARLCKLMSNAGIRMSVFPHLYGDDTVIPKEGFDTTNYNDVPVLMLTGSSEFSLFNLYDGFYKSDAVANWDEDTLNKAQTFATNYGSDMYRIFNAEASAEKMSDNYKSDIYLCQVDYGSINSQSTIDKFGAFHGIFVPMLADTHGYTSVYDFNKEGYKDMSNIFNSYLKNFIATGNPNEDGLTQWNPWTKDDKESLVLDAGENATTATMKDVSTSYDEIIARMEADTTINSDIKAVLIKNVMNGRWFSDRLDEYYGNESLWDN